MRQTSSSSDLGVPTRARNLTPLKLVFALEYVMQGLANPFQGITYQPFFKHFRVDYGLSEAATQRLFAKSYLAWSFKPLLGFLMDAYGRTRTLLIGLLTLAAVDDWEGGKQGDKMVMTSEYKNADGDRIFSRLTYHDITESGFEWTSEEINLRTGEQVVDWKISARRVK